MKRLSFVTDDNARWAALTDGHGMHWLVDSALAPPPRFTADGFEWVDTRARGVYPAKRHWHHDDWRDCHKWEVVCGWRLTWWGKVKQWWEQRERMVRV